MHARAAPARRAGAPCPARIGSGPSAGDRWRRAIGGRQQALRYALHRPEVTKRAAIERAERCTQPVERRRASRGARQTRRARWYPGVPTFPGTPRSPARAPPGTRTRATRAAPRESKTRPPARVTRGCRGRGGAARVGQEEALGHPGREAQRELLEGAASAAGLKRRSARRRADRLEPDLVGAHTDAWSSSAAKVRREGP